ncbi:MAG: hypothetical protein J2P21_13520 [Chloracidobacterium sp.]|nr:hypothetical protein [Chloracidobacterium sp.]
MRCQWDWRHAGIKPVVNWHTIYIYTDAVRPFEILINDGDGKITPNEFPDPAFYGAVLAIDRGIRQ